MLRSRQEAIQFIRESRFVWHQRFRLASDIFTPGLNDIDHLLQIANIPPGLSGKSVLDIGTSNGGLAFEMERRGASRIVAVDIATPDWFGIRMLKEFLDSRVEYVKSSIYDLPSAVSDESFDFVFFWGVLYHLRHPLLALDNVRQLTRELVFIETAVCDADPLIPGDIPLVRFYRENELNNDPSNWFSPNVAALLDWCHSCGLLPKLLAAWPGDAPTRCMVRATPEDGKPEYARISYERPLRVVAPQSIGDREG